MGVIQRWKEKRQFERVVRPQVDQLLYKVDQLGGGSIDDAGIYTVKCDLIRNNRTFRIVIDLAPKRPMIRANGMLLFELSRAEIKRARTTIDDANRRKCRFKQYCYEQDRLDYLNVILGE